jgi:hypothetical protein
LFHLEDECIKRNLTLERTRSTAMSRRTWGTLLVGAGLVSAACSDSNAVPERTGLSAQAVVAPPTSTTGRGPRPAYLLDSMKSMLEQTAAVIEGTVSDITYSFDDQLGPRTNVTLTNVVARIGSLPGHPTQITLPMYGGPSKDGTKFYAATHIARFATGTNYLVFLANHDWFFSPVLRDLALRIETVNGVDTPLDNEGQAITGLNALDFTRTGARFAQPVGAEHAQMHDRTPLLTVSAQDAAACMSKEDFLTAVASFTTTGMAATRFDGSFVSTPQPWVWNKMPTWAPASPTPAPDAGAASGQ